MILIHRTWMHVLFDAGTRLFFYLCVLCISIRVERVENLLYIKSPIDMNSRVDTNVKGV